MLMIKEKCRAVQFLLVSLLLVLSTNLLGQATTDSLKTQETPNYEVMMPDSNTLDINIKVEQLSPLERLRGDLDKAESDEPKSILELFSWWTIVKVLLFIIFSYFCIALFTRFLYYIAETQSAYRITVKGMVPIFRIISWTVVLYIILAGIIEAPWESYAALAASVGLAVGFASQDILKNIFGGLVILFDRPFIVGDKIEVDNFYGEVVEIGLRSTRIVTPDDSQVSIPNAEMMNTSLSNANTGETNCQVVAELYLPIDIDTQEVRRIATEAAQVSSYIYLNKPITVVFFNEVKERRSYLKMRLKAYVMDIRLEFEFKSEMTEIVIRELLEQGILKKEDVS